MVINTRKGNVSYPSKFQYSLFQLIPTKKKTVFCPIRAEEATIVSY